MTITTVSFSQSQETVNEYGLKRWNKFGVEIQCSDTDDPQKAKDYAVSIVENWHKQQIPDNSMKGTYVVPVQDKEVSPDQALIDTINYCTTTRSVEMFRKEVERRNNPLITEAFENKLQSLKNQ